MTAVALKLMIRDIRADGHLSLAEAKTLLKPENGIGNKIDGDEFELIANLRTDIKKFEASTKPAEEQAKELTVANKDRVLDKGTKIGAIVGGTLGGLVAIAAAIGAGSVGTFFSTVIFSGLPILGIGAGIGALAGHIHGRRKPVTKADVENNTEAAKTAKAHHVHDEVQDGVKKGAKIGGAIAGVFGVGFTLGIIGFCIEGGVAAIPAALGLSALVAIPPVGIAVVVLVGLGAVAGLISLKMRQNRNAKVPSGPISADPEAKKLLDEALSKGATAKNHVKSGMKTGTIVGGVVSGLGAIAWGVASVKVFMTSGVAMGFMITGTLFLPLGVAALTLTGACAGIGALVGHIRNKRAAE